MKPALGADVLYKLSAGDAKAIASQRDHASMNGFAVGNAAYEGDVFAARVVNVIDDGEDGVSCNLTVDLDGPDFYWATMRSFGEDPGQWNWMPHRNTIAEAGQAQ